MRNYSFYVEFENVVSEYIWNLSDLYYSFSDFIEWMIESDEYFDRFIDNCRELEDDFDAIVNRYIVTRTRQLNRYGLDNELATLDADEAFERIQEFASAEYINYNFVCNHSQFLDY